MAKRTANRLSKNIIDKTEPGKTAWDSDTPGFGLRVTQAGAKTFIFQFRAVTGEQGRISIGRYPAMTVDEARRIAREHRVLVDKGGNPSRERTERRAGATLKDYATHYCDVYGKECGLAANTISEARSVLKRFALPKYGVRKIGDIKPSDVRTMMADAKQGSGHAQANRLRAVLSKIFNLAIQQEDRADNPCKGVKKFPQDRRWVYLSPDEVRRLLAACDEYPDQNAANAIRLLLFTGARLQEVLKADWSQFDLRRGYWTKPSSHTKTRQLHRLALEPQAIAILEDMKASSCSEFLFPGRDPSKPRTTLKRPWKQILFLAGLGDYRRHDLRRTTASFMLSTGEDLMTVGKTLGHTQAQTTLSYASLMDDVQRRGLSKAVSAMVGEVAII